MKWFLLILAVGCGPAPRVFEGEAPPASAAVTGEQPASPLEIDINFLLDEGTGYDYAKLTVVQRKMLCLTLQELLKQRTPREIYEYLEGIYDGSEPDVMNEKISSMVAIGVALMEGQDQSDQGAD